MPSRRVSGKLTNYCNMSWSTLSWHSGMRDSKRAALLHNRPQVWCNNFWRARNIQKRVPIEEEIRTKAITYTYRR